MFASPKCLGLGMRFSMRFFVHEVDLGHHDGREDEREVDHDVPEELRVGNRLKFHEDAQEVNGRNGDNRRGDLVFERSRIHFAEPFELFGVLSDVEGRDEVFVAREHHHDDEASHEAHVDQGKNTKDEVRFRKFQYVRQDVENFLEKLDRQSEEGGRESDVKRSKKPTSGVHEAFEKDFHDSCESERCGWGRLKKRSVRRCERADRRRTCRTKDRHFLTAGGKIPARIALRLAILSTLFVFFIRGTAVMSASAETSRIVALICAAGVGRRMGADRPKQYLKLGAWPMLVHTVRAIASVGRVAETVVVVSPEDPHIDEAARDFPEGVRVLRAGGAERADSVLNGLLAAGFPDDALVLVHDAARPCVRPSEVEHLIDEVLADPQAAGGLLAVPMTDTVKRADRDRRVVETLPREALWRAATPQCFRAGELIAALSGDRTGITDEASAMERAGHVVKVVSGRTTNIKVTQPGDEKIAGLLLGDASVIPLRIGQGYDSHRLVPGRPLILGGVEIPHTTGLDGHSDADVLLHAVTDAVLGASALGDIGQHFPPSDPAWKGADSRKLLAEVVRLARAKGWGIVNVDATIVAERPKIGPHMAAIRASLAATLGVSEEVVNVKAKTNEKMDAVGREEGMVAHAVALMARI